MRQIPPHSLWLGHAGDGRDFRAILEAGLQAVVQLAVEEEPLVLPRELIFCRFPLVDGAGNEEKLLYLAVTTVANLLERRIPTLVCCGGGMSRSPALAAAALAVVFQEKLEECLERVLAHHPADIVPGLWNDVKALVESRFLA